MATSAPSKPVDSLRTLPGDESGHYRGDPNTLRAPVTQADRDLFTAANANLARTRELKQEIGSLRTELRKLGRFGVLIGSGIGGITTLLDTHEVLLSKGPDRVSPFFIPMLISNLAPGHIAMRYGAKGPNISTTTACAALSRYRLSLTVIASP